MQRARGICLISLLVIAVVLIGLSWWVGEAQTLFADNTGPGVKLQIQNVDIASDGRPIVTFRVTDNLNNPLSLTDLDANSIRFTIARVDTDAATGLTSFSNYVNSTYTGQSVTVRGQALQPALSSIVAPAVSGDSTGTFAGLGNGVHKYTFVTALPPGYPRASTHVVGIQATRGSRAFASNDTFTFVPAGGAPFVTRQVVDTSSCNQCHDPLKVHGSGRVDTKLCVLCHTPQNVDPTSGNVLDFKVLIHRIHDASNLPSVKAGKPFFVGGPNHDFSDVGWPQDVRNCTTCHKNAPQADNWKNAPSAAACTSCHDDVNPLTGDKHAGGVQTDATCKNCHTNTMTREFDLSVPGAHVIPVKSSQLRGISFDLVSFTNTGPGQNPTVVFDIKDKDGKFVAPSDLTSLSLVLAGPTYEYQTEPPVSEAATGATPVGDGTFSYTFKANVPSEASGTWAVGIQGYISTTVQGAGGQTFVGVRDAGFNKVAYSAVTDAIPMPRKKIVALENCNQCHNELGSPAGISIHGGSRTNTEYCPLCHNPNHTGLPAGQTAPVSVQFAKMIHRIHTGEQGKESYGVGTHNYSEVKFPGDRRNCEKCHLPGSNLIDFLHIGSQPTIVRQTISPATTTTGRIVNNAAPVVSITPPIANACTACHDGETAKLHAATQTTAEGTEMCILCHGENADLAVSKVHARR